jgi:hypothetical protein
MNIKVNEPALPLLVVVHNLGLSCLPNAAHEPLAFMDNRTNGQDVGSGDNYPLEHISIRAVEVDPPCRPLEELSSP